MIPIVGLLGEKGHGKDTVCAILGELLPNVQRFALADTLRTEVSEALNIPIDMIVEQREMFRPTLQLWGDIRRDQTDGQYLIRKLACRVAKAHLEFYGSPFYERTERLLPVVTDCRTLEECEWIWLQGGVVIRVFRPGRQTTDPHHTEQGVQNIPSNLIVVNADETPQWRETLRKGVEGLLPYIQGERPLPRPVVLMPSLFQTGDIAPGNNIAEEAAHGAQNLP